MFTKQVFLMMPFSFLSRTFLPPHVGLSDWSVFKNCQEAVSMVKPIPEPEEAAKRLMQEAYQRGSSDNITIIIVRFLAYEGDASHSGGSG